MKTNHRHYILILFAILATALAVGVYVILYKTILTQAAQSFQISYELSQENEKKQHEQDLASIFAKSADDRERNDHSLISQAKIVSFIEMVESIEKQANVKLELSNLHNDDVITDKNPITYLYAHVDAEGTWTNVMRTLLLLENLPYASIVDDVKILRITELSSTSVSSSKKAPPAPTWGLSVNLRVLTSK